MKSFPINLRDSSGQIPTPGKLIEQRLRKTLFAAGNFTWDMSGYQSFSCAISNNGTSPTTIFSFQGSNDGVTWAALQVEIKATSTGANVIYPYVNKLFTIPNVAPAIYVANKETRFVRLTTSNLTLPHTVNISLSSSPATAKTDAVLRSLESQWSYATPSGGITTSPTTIKAASSNAFRNTILALQIKNTGSAGSEYTIEQDSATATDGSGTVIAVLFRDYIGAGESKQVKFPFPLVGTGGKLLRFTLSTTTNVTVYLNVQGLIINN